jgi:hypothetical protein
LFFEKRLREKARRRAIVLIGIVEPVRVELELAVVEVEVRRVREIAIDVRLYCLHPSISLEVKKSFLPVFYSVAVSKTETSTLDKGKQYLLKTALS